MTGATPDLPALLPGPGPLREQTEGAVEGLGVQAPGVQLVLAQVQATAGWAAPGMCGLG